MKIRYRHAAGVLSGGRLLVGGLGVVALAAGASAVALKAGVGAPSARLQPDSAALTRVTVSGHGAHLESVHATGPGGAAIPVSVRDGRVWPTVDLPVGEKVVITATITRSAPVSWVLGRHLPPAARGANAEGPDQQPLARGACRLAHQALVRGARRPRQHPLREPPRGPQAAAHVALAHASRIGVCVERANGARRGGSTHLGDPSRPRARHLVRGGRSPQGGRDPAPGRRRARPRRHAAPHLLATGQRDLRQAPADAQPEHTRPLASARRAHARVRPARRGLRDRREDQGRAAARGPARRTPEGNEDADVERRSRLDAPAAAAAREPRLPARAVGAVRHAGPGHGRGATGGGDRSAGRSLRLDLERRSRRRCAPSGAPARSPR